VKNPLFILIILILVAAVMYPFGNVMGVHIPSQNPEEIAAMPIGSTVLNGTNVINDNNLHKVPLLYHPEYLVQAALEKNYVGLLTSIITGAVPTPVEAVVNSDISNSGVAEGYTGPGILTVQGNKLAVNPPNTFVYGYVTPYTVAVKNNGSVKLIQNNKTTTVSVHDFSNNTIPHEYMDLNSFETWYNNSNVGDNTTLDYGLSNFSDGRNMVPPNEIKTDFGTNISNYIQSRAPTSDENILVYNAGKNEVVVSSDQTVMDYYADMDNNGRVANALAFIQAWNNTIIPPHSIGYCTDNVSYVSVYDPDPTQGTGWADHGTCPPGRALRDVSLAAGFPLPTGMSYDYTNVINDDASLSDGITVYNTLNYPVKITIWMDGASTGSPIYAQVTELLP
jgi:archaellum component FlaG (FlaF/FlaG flagellin family)